jgi:hypothetical protein
MVPMNVAVVPYSRSTDPGNLAKVTAALQVQVARDFGPIWGIDATVTPLPSLDDVPPGYIVVALVESLPNDRGGVHYAVAQRPVGLVKYSDSWSLMASHELLEMICDPWGNRVMPGRSPIHDQGQVEYLLEICDPCQACTYLIDGVLVSDFVTPEYYATSWTEGLRYSFLGSVKKPRDVLDGGYITWRVPGSEQLWQQIGDGQPKQLGSSILAGLSMRGYVDAKTQTDTVSVDPPFPNKEIVADAIYAYEQAALAAKRYGGALRRDIGRMIGDTAAGKKRAQVDELPLLKELAKNDAVRKRYKLDTHAEMRRHGLDPDGVPETAPNLAPKEVFAWVVARIEAADIFGDGVSFLGGPLWWLAGLGGG